MSSPGTRKKKREQVLAQIIDQADPDAVNAFGDAAKQAGRASPEGEGNWAKSTFEDLVQYNDGFKTNLIGTPQQIAERIVALKAVGVDLVLGGVSTFSGRGGILRPARVAVGARAGSQSPIQASHRSRIIPPVGAGLARDGGITFNTSVACDIAIAGKPASIVGFR